MTKIKHLLLAATLCLSAIVANSPTLANAYREKGKAVDVADSRMTVTPPRDWNRLSQKPGKNAETWTLDGEELNDVTFFGGIEPGKPLVREVDKKRKPLPKLTSDILLVEVPELLERTYRTSKEIGTFAVTGSSPDSFLGLPGIRFNYNYTDNDNLLRKGEARAALVKGRLYMVTFDAPRLHYFDKTLNDFHALVDTVKLL